MSEVNRHLLRIDLGIFAHDEAEGIAQMVVSLAAQDVLETADFSVRILLLANGCTDATARLAREAATRSGIEDRLEIFELPKGGKSQTWNTFVHGLTRPDATFMIFCDADISLPKTDALTRLIRFVSERPDLVAASSRPVKDIVYDPPVHMSLSDRLIVASGGTLDDWKESICGQLYVLRGDKARELHLPIGLPVEDGFVRAMITTDILRQRPMTKRLDGLDSIFHVYKSERGIISLLNHQVRIVIGSAINSVLFRHLGGTDVSDVRAELAQAARDPDWLPRILKAHLPEARYGYVPWHFLFKRLSGLKRKNDAKRQLILLAGFGFDAIVWLIAQLRMSRGAGAGYW